MSASVGFVQYTGLDFCPLVVSFASVQFRVCSLSDTFRRVLSVGSSRRARNHFTATGFVLRESLFAANAAPVLILLHSSCLLLHNHVETAVSMATSSSHEYNGDFPIHCACAHDGDR